MKPNFFLSLSFLFLIILPSFAQTGSLSLKAGENIYKHLPDSILYVFPSFDAGSVIMKQGGSHFSIINICTLDQSIRFINEAGDTLKILDDNAVESVIRNNRLFKRWGNRYIEVLDAFTDVSLGVERMLSIKEQKKEGAYGTASLETSSSTSIYSNFSISGYTYYDANLEIPYSYKETIYLMKGKKFMLANKKNFIKIFPHKKNEIISYFEQNNIKFDSLEDIKPLFKFCSEKVEKSL